MLDPTIPDTLIDLPHTHLIADATPEQWCAYSAAGEALHRDNVPVLWRGYQTDRDRVAMLLRAPDAATLSTFKRDARSWLGRAPHRLCVLQAWQRPRLPRGEGAPSLITNDLPGWIATLSRTWWPGWRVEWLTPRDAASRKCPAQVVTIHTPNGREQGRIVGTWINRRA